MMRPTTVADPLTEYIVVSEETTTMTTHTSPAIERLLTLAYDMEQQGQPVEAEQLRTEARRMSGLLDQMSPQARAFCELLETSLDTLPADDQDITIDVLARFVDAADAYQQGADDTLAAIERRLVERSTQPASPLLQDLKAWVDTKFHEEQQSAEHPLNVAARAYSAAATPENYAALKQAWADAGLPVKDDEYDDYRGALISTEGDITCTRVDSSDDRSWLDFTIGDHIPHRMLVGVDIVGGRPGCELLIWGNQIHEDGQTLTLDQLRQIHADLGAMLADERLLGALAGQ